MNKFDCIEWVRAVDAEPDDDGDSDAWACLGSDMATIDLAVERRVQEAMAQLRGELEREGIPPAAVEIIVAAVRDRHRRQWAVDRPLVEHELFLTSCSSPH